MNIGVRHAAEKLVSGGKGARTVKEGVRTAGATPSEPPPLTRSGECVGARGRRSRGRGRGIASPKRWWRRQRVGW